MRADLSSPRVMRAPGCPARFLQLLIQPLGELAETGRGFAQIPVLFLEHGQPLPTRFVRHSQSRVAKSRRCRANRESQIRLNWPAESGPCSGRNRSRSADDGWRRRARQLLRDGQRVDEHAPVVLRRVDFGADAESVFSREVGGPDPVGVDVAPPEGNAMANVAGISYGSVKARRTPPYSCRGFARVHRRRSPGRRRDRLAGPAPRRCAQGFFHARQKSRIGLRCGDKARPVAPGFILGHQIGIRMRDQHAHLG